MTRSAAFVSTKSMAGGLFLVRLWKQMTSAGQSPQLTFEA